MVLKNLQIRFVSSTKSYSAGSWYRMATAPALTGSANVPKKRIKANVTKMKGILIRDQLRFLISLLKNPVLNSGHIADPSCAALRLIDEQPVYYTTYVPTGSSHRIVKINLHKHMQRYGTNIGYLRSRLRTSTLSAAQRATVHAAPKRIPAWRNCFTLAVRKAKSLVSGIFSGSSLAQRLTPRPEPCIFSPPAGTQKLEVYYQAAGNSFMLLKFFYPEVFLQWDLPCKEPDVFIAALGYSVRRKTVLQTESAFFAKRLSNQWNTVCKYAMTITPKHSRPMRTEEMNMHPKRFQFRFEWPDPRLAISEHFAYMDRLRCSMESDPAYIRAWEAVAELAARKYPILSFDNPVDLLASKFAFDDGCRYGNYIRPFRTPEHIVHCDLEA